MYRVTSRLISVCLIMIVLLMPIILVSFLSDTLDVTTTTILPPLWSSALRSVTTEVALHRLQSAVAVVHRADDLVARYVPITGYIKNSFVWNATKLCTSTDGIVNYPTRPPPSGAVEWGRPASGDATRRLRDILLQARTLAPESMVPAVLFPQLVRSPIPPPTTVPPNRSSSTTTLISTTTTTTTTTSTTTTTTTTTTLAPNEAVVFDDPCPFPNIGLDTLAVPTAVMRENWISSVSDKVVLPGNASIQFSFLKCPLDKQQIYTINQDLTHTHLFWPHFVPMVQWFPAASAKESVLTSRNCVKNHGAKQVALIVSRVMDKLMYDTKHAVRSPDDSKRNGRERTRTATRTRIVPPPVKEKGSHTVSRTLVPTHHIVETHTMGAISIAFDRQLAIDSLALIPRFSMDSLNKVPVPLRTYERELRDAQGANHLSRILGALGGNAVGAIMWDALYDVGMMGVGPVTGYPAVRSDARLNVPRRDLHMHCDLLSLLSTGVTGSRSSKNSFTIDQSRSQVRDFCAVQLDRDVLHDAATGIWRSNSPTDVEHFRNLLSLAVDTDPAILDSYRTPSQQSLDAALGFFGRRFVEGLFEVERNSSDALLVELGRQKLNLSFDEIARMSSLDSVAEAAAHTPQWMMMRLERQRRLQEMITGPAVDNEPLYTALDGNASSLIYVVPQDPEVKGLVGGLLSVADVYVVDIVPRAVFDAQQDSWLSSIGASAHPYPHIDDHAPFAFENLGERIVSRSYPYRTSQYSCSIDTTVGSEVQSPVDFELSTLTQIGAKHGVGGGLGTIDPTRCRVPTSFVVMRRMSLIVLADDPDNILGSDIFSGPVAATIIANICTTCLAIVFVFAVLDALFRPLRELAGALRSIADDQIREVPRAGLSRIAEIRDVQLLTEGLVSAVTLYSRFLPARSLLMDSAEIEPAEASTRWISASGSFLHAVWKQLGRAKAHLLRQHFADDDAVAAAENSDGLAVGAGADQEMKKVGYYSSSAVNSNSGGTTGSSSSNDKSNKPGETARIQGSTHTIWIKATYRSRRDPDRVRTTYDPKKHCSFRHTFACGDDVYSNVLEEIRRRLTERVGEPLQLRDVGYNALPVSMGDAGQVTSLDADLHGSRKMLNTADLMECVERSHGRPLYLVVLKTAKKNFFPWIHALFSFLATIFMYQISREWAQTPISDVPRESAKAIVAFVSIRIAYNLIVSTMLLVWFTAMQPLFFSWMCMAIPEVVIAIFLSAFSVDGVFVLFSSLSLGWIRFNAPYKPAMAVASRFALPGHVLGDALGMIPLGYAAAFEGSDVVSTVVVFAILFSLISLFLSFFYSPIMQRVALWFPKLHLSSSIGDCHEFEEWDARAEADPLRVALNASSSSASASRSASQQQQQQQQQHNYYSPPKSPQHGDHDRRTASVGSVTSTVSGTHRNVSVASHHVRNNSNRTTFIPIAKQPPMNLCEREASVVKLALRDAPYHIEKLSGVQMAELIQGFVGLVTREAEVYGGLVLRVMGTEVTVGFNCHHIQNFHVLSAAKFYFAVHRAINERLRVWCPDDDLARPQVVGALVSGASLAIGYIGTAEARSVQHLGIGEMLLQNLIGLAEHMGAQFLTTRQAAGQLQLQADFSRKTFEADRLRRAKARDRVVQSLLANAAEGSGAAGGVTPSLSQPHFAAVGGAGGKSGRGGRHRGGGGGGGGGGTIDGRSPSANSVESLEPSADHIAREKKNREMESFAAFFAELDDPAADADVVLMHCLRVREVDGISITLPAYHRDRFRSALDHDGISVSSTPYERDLAIFEVVNNLSQEDIARFNRDVEVLLRGISPSGGQQQLNQQLQAASPTSQSNSGGGGAIVSGGGFFAQYCLTHPFDSVAQTMKFVHASRNPTGRNVRFVTPLGVGFRRVELRLAQVAAHARGDASDYDEDYDLLDGVEGDEGKPTTPAEALRRATIAASLKNVAQVGGKEAAKTAAASLLKQKQKEDAGKTKKTSRKRQKQRLTGGANQRVADEHDNDDAEGLVGANSSSNNNNNDSDYLDDDDLDDDGDDNDDETNETKRQETVRVRSPNSLTAGASVVLSPKRGLSPTSRNRSGKTRGNSALRTGGGGGGGAGHSDAVIQKIQNKDKYTLHFTDL